MRNALDLGAAVAHGVKRFFGAGKVPVYRRALAARRAKVNVARKLAHDKNIQPRHQLGLEAGGVHQLFVANGRAQIGVQAQCLAQPQNGLLGAQVAFKLVVLPIAHGAKQHGIGRLGQLQGVFGQGVAVFFVGCAAYVGMLHLQRQIQRLEDFDRFGNDFRADAVTGKNGDFHNKCFVNRRTIRSPAALMTKARRVQSIHHKAWQSAWFSRFLPKHSSASATRLHRRLPETGFLRPERKGEPPV